MKIAVCNVSIGKDYNEKKWVKNAIKNHKNYCKYNNYDYIIRNNPETNRSAHWEKIDLLIKVINKYDIVFWMDTDSVFLNFNIKIEELIPENTDFIFSGDTNIINTGHFIFRNTEWSKLQLKNIYDIFPANYGMKYDNAAMAVWLGGGNGKMSHEEQNNIYDSVDKGYKNKNIQTKIEKGLASEYISKNLRNNIKIIPKKKINSYLRDYSEGDFILHMVNSNDYKRNLIFSSCEPNLIINNIKKFKDINVKENFTNINKNYNLNIIVLIIITFLLIYFVKNTKVRNKIFK